MFGKWFGKGWRDAARHKAARMVSGVEPRGRQGVASPPRGSTSLTMRLLGGLILVAGLCLPVAAQSLTPLPPQPDGLAWPTAGWEEGPLPEETAGEIEALVDDAMALNLGDTMGETRAVVIIHQGRLVLEAYRDGFGPETKQVSWSMAKSITSALVGRAVELGLIADIDYPMPSPFPEGDRRRDITWRQWLTMTDGLDYTEIGATGLEDNDVVQMMYGPGRFDVTQYIVDELPLAREPGVTWNYSTAGFHLIGWALIEHIAQAFTETASDCLDKYDAEFCREVYSVPALWESGVPGVSSSGRRHLAAEWMNGVLFNPIGMDAQPEFDTAGTYLGGSLVWASARDFAKFGYLYLRDGVWEGERLLPEGWVDMSRRDPRVTDANVYGAGWWLTPRGEASHPGQAATSPPYDAFSAQGHEGQTIWVVPSRDLVIVHLGLMANEGDNWPALYEWNQSIARLFPEGTGDTPAEISP